MRLQKNLQSNCEAEGDEGEQGADDDDAPGQRGVAAEQKRGAEYL
jgi:hypothetical protein